MPSRMPPAALVSTTVRQPAAAAVRTPCATGPTPCPSYRWVRPSSTSTRRSPTRTERIVPPCPSTVGGTKPGSSAIGELALGRADDVGRGPPAGAEHHGDVVPVDAGAFGDGGGGGGGDVHAPNPMPSARTRPRATRTALATREPAAERGTVSVITHTVPVPGTIRRHEVRASVR